eukprot:12986209-Heterocapsa_arctica.AAC.1
MGCLGVLVVLLPWLPWCLLAPWCLGGIGALGISLVASVALVPMGALVPWWQWCPGALALRVGFDVWVGPVALVLLGRLGVLVPCWSWCHGASAFVWVVVCCLPWLCCRSPGLPCCISRLVGVSQRSWVALAFGCLVASVALLPMGALVPWSHWFLVPWRVVCAF